MVARHYIRDMAQMVSEVYDALRSVNVPEDKARKAAEALALPEMSKTYESRFTKIDGEISTLKTDATLLKWMVGFNIAMTAGILGRMLFVH